MPRCPRPLPADGAGPGLCERHRHESLRLRKRPESITRGRLQTPRTPVMGDRAARTPLNPLALVSKCPVGSGAVPAALEGAMESGFSPAL